MRTRSKRIVIWLLAIALTPAGLAGQQAGAPSKAEGARLKPWVGLDAEVDNNVFKLSPGKKRALNDPSDADISSGRFTGMKGAEDLIVQARGGIDVKLDGMGGRTLTLAPALRYDRYVRNTERSHLTASVSLAQALARGMRTKLEASHTPSYFPRNYLIDGTGTSPGQRRYARAEYSATQIDLSHRLRLRKRTARSPLAAHLELGAGYYTRSHDAPFASRDLSGPALRSRLLLSPWRRMDVEAGYELEKLSNDAAQAVDRSRRQHELKLGARLGMTRRTDLEVRYGLRSRSYLSEQPLDLAHRDRRDTRHDVRGELSTRLARGVRFSTGARLTRQTTNRLFDSEQTDEAADFTRIRGFAGVRLGF